MLKDRSAFIPLLVTAAFAFGLGGNVSAKDNTPPPREIPLIEKKREQLSIQEVGELGKLAFTIDPRKWKHAESENFVLHFRRATEARRVVREVEFTLWYVAKALDKTRNDYARKSNIFIFSGTSDWKTFLTDSGVSSWAASFAHGDDLYLNIGGAVEAFDSQLLAHEATHAVVSRLYPEKRWPLWLNEGFAEYMATASIAARRQQTLKTMQKNLTGADLPLEKLVELKEYPKDQQDIRQLYTSGERVVRFLMTRLPADRFPKFVDATLAGKTLEEAVLEVYSDKMADYATFKREYAGFER